MDLRTRLFPGDWLVAGYNLILVLVWLPQLGRGGHVAWIVAAHAVGATLPWLLARVPHRPWGIGGAIRDMYPLILALGFWLEIDVLRATAQPLNYDHVIGPLDQALFGSHPHAIWMPRMDDLWFSEAMYFMYYAYYALIFIPPVVVAWQGRRDAVRDMTLRLMAGYLACYLIYIAFPVDGPHFLESPHQGPHTEGVFYRLVAATQAAGDSRGCAFPSSHVVGAVTIALLGWRWFRRPVALVLTVEALGVVLSTVYTQLHYAIDSLAGIVFGIAVQLWLVPAILYVTGSAPASPALPVGLESVPAFERTREPRGSA